MKLSIVIPAYNEEKYLAQCLDAVKAAVEKNVEKDNIEIIVVNNASVDMTGEIAHSFDDVKVVDEPKRGLPQARQAGFAASSGEFIANIDADTKLPKGWLEKVQKEFADDEKLVALSGPYVYYDLPKSSSMLVEFWYLMGYVTNYLNQNIFKKGAMLQGGNFVLRRSALEEIGGFDTSIDFWGEDTDVARRISTVGKVKFTFTLKMPTSARRFKKDGLVIAGWKYFINYFWVLFFKKPFTKKYENLQ